MSGFTPIDLSKLDPPEVIKTVDFDALLQEMKAEAIKVSPQLAPYLGYESETATQILRICAHFRMLDRLEFNDGARALMLAYSTGTNLDHLGAPFGVERPTIQEANKSISPAIPEIRMDDEEYRQLIPLSLNGHTTAGPRGSYIYWARKASGVVKDVTVDAPRFTILELDPALAAQLPENAIVLGVADDAGLDKPMPGDVAITVLSREEGGIPSQAVLDAVKTMLNDEDIRPLTDRPRCRAATIIPYQIDASLILYDGPDASTVITAARDALTTYVKSNQRLGHDITLSGIYQALHQPGVQNVHIIHPPGDIVVGSNEAAVCAAEGIRVTVGGRDV